MAQAVIDEFRTVYNSATVPAPTHADNDLLFFSSIDDATKSWLKSLQEMWELWKKCDVVIQMLTDYFETAPNPYLSTLRIVVNTSDFNHMKSRSSLAFTVIEEYGKWLEHRKEMYKECLAVDLKIAAFRLITKQKNMQFIKMCAIIYDFKSDNVMFLDLIKKMIEEQKYKEAAQCVAMLHLHDHFSHVETLLLPLILQNKLTVVEDLLMDSPKGQKNLITYLDNLIAPGTNMQTILDEFIILNNIQDVQLSTIQTKPITKMISRFLKQYNLPSELCPNLTKKRSEGALQFLIHKRYVDRSLSVASWREMVREAVGLDKRLQSDLIRMLIHENDTKEGLYWAQEFNIPEKEWPWAISYYAEQLESERVNGAGASTSRENADDWIDEEVMNYHDLQLSKDSIKVVDSPRTFEDFLDNGLKDVSIVGIDSEWKPSFGIKQTELALIQISTHANVYILDVTTIGKELSELWMELGIRLFENKDILKLGFGISHDMTVIRNSLPALSKIKPYGPGYLDIVHLWKKLVDGYKFMFPHERDQHFANESLSKLVELCLGQRLNKSDQFSNWEQRPLRDSQIKYAALDAYCLLEIYGVLEKQCARLDIPFHEICAEIQHIPHKQPKKNIRNPMHTPRASSDCQLQIHNKQENHENRHHQRFRSFQSPKYPNTQKYSNRPENRNRADHFNRPVQHTIKADHSIRPEHLTKPPYLRKPDHQNRYQKSYVQRCEQIPAHKWRVVCDPMLRGLTDKLRMCGCDSIEVNFHQSGEQFAKLAMLENRVLLTRHNEYEKFKRFLRPNNCYLLRSETLEDQLCEVLDRFNVVVTRKDIFSRCQICNNDEFAKVPKVLMDELVKSFAKLTRKNNYRMNPELTNHHEMDASEVNRYRHGGGNMNQYEYNEYRTWRLSTNSLNVNTCTTKYQIRVQIHKVRLHVLRNVSLFYVCEHCGEVYWDGMPMEHELNGILKDRIIGSYPRVR